MTLDFEKAIQIAKNELKKIQQDASAINVEQALISDDEKQYEITFSYQTELNDKLSANNKPSLTESLSINKDILPTHLQSLSNILRRKRVYKTFLINIKDFKFRGFKNFN